MKLRLLPVSTALGALLLLTGLGHAQTIDDSATAELSSVPLAALSSSSSSTSAGFVTLPPSGLPRPRTFHPFTGIGIASRTGLAGAGFDVATPLSRGLNLRAGAGFFSYASTFQEQGANVAINLRMKSGHAALDWFPFHGRFRLSSMLVFANNNRLLATALIPSGSTVTLNGQDYISSYADPLHGNGRIDFRRVSPGFTFGFGNIIPRTRSHFSIPVEMGFYYVGQPTLQVAFSGSACDPSQPPSIGCQSVDQDATFQQNLKAFISRNNNNLSYASFLPILSVGFGYSF